MGRINKKQVNYGKLEELIKQMDKKISVKVGILNPLASEQHENSGLTNAELGAIHELGATINVTDKMRNYLHAQGLHLKKDTATIVIPTRSFLRMPLLSNEGKKHLINEVLSQLVQEELAYKIDYNEGAESFLLAICEQLGQEAVLRVYEAFETGGFGKWAPVSEYTKEHRYLGNAGSPPLTDTGALKGSVTYEVKEIK